MFIKLHKILFFYSKFQAYPLDMSQYEGLFNATRIPRKGKDVIFRKPSARHVLVMKNGNFFVFDALDMNGKQGFSRLPYISC